MSDLTDRIDAFVAEHFPGYPRDAARMGAQESEGRLILECQSEIERLEKQRDNARSVARHFFDLAHEITCMGKRLTDDENAEWPWMLEEPCDDSP